MTQHIDIDSPIFLEKLKQGDREAFRQLVLAHQVQVVNTCYRFLLDHHDAEEVAQDVFCDVFQSIQTFREKSRLSTWVYRIAVNRSMDALRKQGRQKRGGLWKRISGMDSNDEEAHFKAPEHHNPDQILSVKENLGLVQKALRQLPEKQQKAFVLKQVEGFSQKEIAGILGVTESAVESLMTRARQQLRKKLTHLLKK